MQTFLVEKGSREMLDTKKFPYQTDKSSHRSCSLKKLFLKISQYSQENTCAAVFFNLKNDSS